MCQNHNDETGPGEKKGETLKTVEQDKDFTDSP
jgi:hypothetical protein